MWKRDYSGSVRRLVRDGVDMPLASLFVHAARRCLQTPMAPIGREARRRHSLSAPGNAAGDQRAFRASTSTLPIAFDGMGRLEVDLLCADTQVAVELDGAQHLADPVAYRRDRRKDQVLQENGYLVLRFLAEDVGKELDAVLDAILRALSNRAIDGSTRGSAQFPTTKSHVTRAGPNAPAGNRQSNVVAGCDRKGAVERNHATAVAARQTEEVSVRNLLSLWLARAHFGHDRRRDGIGPEHVVTAGGRSAAGVDPRSSRRAMAPPGNCAQTRIDAEFGDGARRPTIRTGFVS